MGFTHLHAHSNFSFLDGGSSVRALLDRAKEIGCESLALTDHNGLYGAVRFYDYALKVGVKPIVGVEINVDGEWRAESGESGMGVSIPHPPSPNPHLVLLAKNLNGYSNLCKIITRAQLSHEKGEAAASLSVIEQYKSDLFCLSGCAKGEIASQLGLRCVATNNVHYAAKEDFKVQDLLVCVRTLTKLDERHPLCKLNSEYYLKTPRAMANLFRKYPKAVAGFTYGEADSFRRAMTHDRSQTEMEKIHASFVEGARSFVRSAGV